MKAEKILEELVKINTVKDKENGKIMDFISKYLSKKGFAVKFVTDPKTNKKNLLAQLDPKKPNGLFFVGHTDTVPESSDWNKNPFMLTKQSGKFFGLGASDMKGGIAAFLSAINEIDLKNIKTNLGMVLTYDEETTFGGIKDFLKKIAFENNLVIIGEPTDGFPIVATKGVLAMRAEFFGKAAHGSTPAKGKNAIVIASRFVEELLVLEKELLKEKNPLFNPPNATLNIGKVIGGDAINKVPAHCVLDFEFRVINNVQSKKIITGIKKIIQDKYFRANFKILMQFDPMMNNKGNFIATVEKISKNKLMAANYATEGSFLGGTGNQIVILGPGPVMAHMADEYITEKSFNSIIKVYVQIIKKSCF